MSNVTGDFTTYSEYKVGVFVWKSVSPILIILGTVGNVLSIIVLTRKSIRSSTTALYLTVLAVSDLVVLYSGLLRQWLNFLFETDVRHVSAAGCKIHIWIVYTSLDFSAWILIAVTLERVISAWFPHNAKRTCTKKSAIALLSSILVFLLLLNSHMLYGMGFKYVDNGFVTEQLKCQEIDLQYVHFFNKVWPWIDLCAFCLVPCSVIIVGNSLIVFKVIKSRKKTNSRIAPLIATWNSQRQSTTHDKQSAMTALLFTLNVVFLVCTSPISIYNIGYVHWASDAEENLDNRKLAELDLWWAVVNMLMYTNNSLNFLLYFLSATKFRQELARIFCRRFRNNSIDTVHSNYTCSTRFDHSSAAPSNKVTRLAVRSPAMAASPSSTNRNSNKGTDTTNGDLGISTIAGSVVHSNAALETEDGDRNKNLNTDVQTITSVV